MRKLLIILGIAIMLMSCGSTRGTLYGTKQREEKDLPKWAGQGVTFRTDEASAYGSVILPEKGIYACGMSEKLGSQRITADAASLSARVVLAKYIAAKVNSTEKRETFDSDVQYEAVDEVSVNNLLVGTRTVDTYSDEKTGNIYSLMFISNSNIKKSFAQAGREIKDDF